MSKRKYPNLSVKTTIKEYKGQMCQHCPPKTKAVARITIEHSYMRGDDDVFLVCSNHLAAATQGKWEQFYKK